MFSVTSTTPAQILINSTTAPNFALWNPAGSGKNAVLVRYSNGWNATTEAPGNIQLMVLTGAGSNVATAAPVITWTNVAPSSTLLGSGKVSAMKAATAATSLTGVGVVGFTLGLNHLTTTGTATFGSYTADYLFYETVIVTPGTLVYTAGSASTATTYNQTLIWYEEAAF